MRVATGGTRTDKDHTVGDHESQGIGADRTYGESVSKRLCGGGVHIRTHDEHIDTDCTAHAECTAHAALCDQPRDRI